MAIPAIDYAHVRLTVTDIAKSRKFYDDVFGFTVAFEAPPESADDATKEAMSFLFGGVIYSFGGGLLGLRPVAPASDEYDENRVGLDHVSFSLPSKAAIDEAASHLDGLAIAHEGVKNIGSGYILEFRDPDNIALELFAPAS